MTQLSVAALRSTQRTVNLCRRLGYPNEKICVVVNRFQSGEVLSPADAEDVLKAEKFFFKLAERLSRGIGRTHERRAGGRVRAGSRSLPGHSRSLRGSSVEGRLAKTNGTSHQNGAGGSRLEESVRPEKELAHVANGSPLGAKEPERNGGASAGRPPVSAARRDQASRDAFARPADSHWSDAGDRVIDARSGRVCTHAAAASEDKLSAVDQLKVDLHRRLIERLDLEALEQIKDEARSSPDPLAVVEFLRAEPTPLSQAEREEIVEQIVYEVTGLGPIEPLFRDPTHHATSSSTARRTSTSSGAASCSRARTHVPQQRAPAGGHRPHREPRRPSRRRVVADGRRASARRLARQRDHSAAGARRPGALDPPLRRRAHGRAAARRTARMTTEMLTLLAGCVQARLNVLISGGTGSGKTTLLNALSSFIPADERIVTIEDAAELRLQQEHVVRLETRPPNSEGRGEVLARDLVKNALRMRPDRIIVGEVRGAEALDMLQAMNTGHEGSLTTIHANTPRDALARLETMILFAGTNLPNRAMREQISSAIDVISRCRAWPTARAASRASPRSPAWKATSSRRRRSSASTPRHDAGRPDRRAFEATGVRPHFTERLRVAGIELPSRMFEGLE